MEQQKRLYRSRFDTVIGGVSGGLAKYFEIDILLIRLLFVVLALFAAGGIVAYIILWIIMPVEPDEYFKRNKTFKNTEYMENEETSSNQESRGNKPYHGYKKPKNNGSLIAGILLITLGGMFLISRFIPRINFGDMWPVILIIVGIIIIASASRSKNRY